MNFPGGVATKGLAENTSTDRIATEATQPRSLARTVAVFILFLLLVCVIQREAGAPSAAFGGFPDESAHYVGGLAMHDYVAKALSQNPIRFLEDYHVRLPFFAIGVWPPFFYMVEGAWMELFGVQRASVLWMIALSAAGLATFLFGILWKQCGFWTAVAGGLAFLLIPIVQWSACLVMVDLTCSLLALAATIFFARFVEKGHWQDSALFGILAGLSLLTKNSTFFLCLIPPIVIAAGRRWDLLRNPALWLAPLLVATIYGPWLLLSRPFLLLGIHGLQLPGFWGTQRDYVTVLWRQMSILFPAGLAGGLFLAFSKQKMSALALCMFAVVPAVSLGIFIARVPIQDRLLMVSYCALLFLAMELLSTLLRASYRAPITLACVLVLGYVNWMNFRRPPENDIRGVVSFIQAGDAGNPGAVLLPSSNEGPWLAEFAETEPKRPQRIMLRPTKTLGTEDWNGTNWQPYYKSPDELRTFFERTPVRYCILLTLPKSGTPGRVYPHDALLESALTSDPVHWRLLLERATTGGGRCRVFENLQWTPASEQKVYAEVNRGWKKYLP